MLKPARLIFVEWFRNYYGPTVRAFGALEPQVQDALASDLESLLEDWSISGDETLFVLSDYLEAVAVKS